MSKLSLNIWLREIENKRLDSLLVSAGRKFIFFLVAGTGMCFGWSMRIRLVTHGCFSCCSLSGFVNEELHKMLVGNMARTAVPNWQGDIPQHKTSCWVCKLDEVAHEGSIAACGRAGHQSKGGEQLRWFYWALVLPSFCYNCCYVFVWLFFWVFYFVLIIKVLWPQPMSFIFFPWFSTPYTGVRLWASSRVVLSCQLRLNHDSQSEKDNFL